MRPFRTLAVSLALSLATVLTISPAVAQERWEDRKEAEKRMEEEYREREKRQAELYREREKRQEEIYREREKRREEEWKRRDEDDRRRESRDRDYDDYDDDDYRRGDRRGSGSYERAHAEFHRQHDYACRDRAARRPLDPIWQVRVRSECKVEHDRWHDREGIRHDGRSASRW